MTLHWLSAAEPGALDCPHENILGGAVLGDLSSQTPDWPVQHLSTQVLASEVEGNTLIDAWVLQDDAEVVSGQTDGIAYRRCSDILYGHIALDEAGYEMVDGKTPLQQASFGAYDRLFRFLEAQGTPNIWKLWIYMADINAESHGLERYRQFNVGRAEAYEQNRRAMADNVPAACVLGYEKGPLTVAFIASSRPVQTIENPRQVSAFHYPDQYGPRKPLFARAAVACSEGRPTLFISGTASIVGHETVHLGDPVAQAAECLNNIEALLKEVYRVTGNCFGIGDLAFRVYVRHPEHLPGIRQIISERIGSAQAVYLRADVCRSDLLVEIEGHSV